MRKPHEGQEQQDGSQQAHDKDPRLQRVRRGRSCEGLDHVGGRDAGGRQIWGGDVFAAHFACWEEYSLCGKT